MGPVQPLRLSVVESRSIQAADSPIVLASRFVEFYETVYRPPGEPEPRRRNSDSAGNDSVGTCGPRLALGCAGDCGRAVRCDCGFDFAAPTAENMPPEFQWAQDAARLKAHCLG